MLKLVYTFTLLLEVSMKKELKLSLIGQFILLLATIAWGASFFILKGTINEYPPMYVIGFRFLSASVILTLIFIKKIIKISRRTFLRGATLGVFMGLAYITQTYGLTGTTPATNAFLTSLYCILCPFFLWLFFKVVPKTKHVVSAVICLGGLALIAFSSGNEGQNTFLGCLLTIAGAIFFCAQLVFIDKFQKEDNDTITLLIVQLATASLMVLALSFITEFPTYGIDGMIFKKEHLFNVIYLTVACTILAPLFQMIGQKLTTPNQASIILCFEAVFGAIFSVAFGAEELSLMLALGFVVIFISVFITEINVDYKKLLGFIYKKPSNEEIEKRIDKE